MCVFLVFFVFCVFCFFCVFCGFFWGVGFVCLFVLGFIYLFIVCLFVLFVLLDFCVCVVVVIAYLFIYFSFMMVKYIGKKNISVNQTGCAFYGRIVVPGRRSYWANLSCLAFLVTEILNTRNLLQMTSIEPFINCVGAFIGLMWFVPILNKN